MNVNNVIFEIFRTDVPSFSDGVYKCPWINGCKVKATAAGNLSVRYAGDADGVYRVLAVPGTNTWDLPDRIIEIRDHSDTTLDLANVLVGTGFTD
tara:strand:+ start:1059 stop:1343 length:285 start_codon:yes stop_codon:yes gene_type:complete